MFADLASGGEETQRLRFQSYAHALALADLVLPVSETSGRLLTEWLVVHGHRPPLLPPIVAVPLPQQVFGERRVVPESAVRAGERPIEFLALGVVSAHKNQMSAMAAFHRLAERRPDLDLVFHVVGHVAPQLAVPASLMAKRSKGRIRLHGWLPDAQVRALTATARATVFVSLAEGYGLPVAESLWFGRPCLCSGEGAIGEIARGGGCLTVDPDSLDAIEAGFEILATDPVRYDALLGQIAQRRMKSWEGYAAEIVQALDAVASGRPPPSPAGTGGPLPASGDEPARGSEERARTRDAVFMVAASDLAVPPEFAAPGRARSLYHGSAIRYDRERDGSVAQDVLFFGPGVPLPAGRYAFSLDGEIDGELQLVFRANPGRTPIAAMSVTGFSAPVALDLARDVTQFEIVGMRGPGLRRMVLRGVFAEVRGAGAGPDSEAAPLPAPAPADERKSGRAGKPIALDDDGRALALPCDFPAERMRVRDESLRADGAIAFDTAGAAGDDRLLFFGPYLHLEPGVYSFRFRGALKGSLKVRFTSNYSSNLLREQVVTTFDAPIALVLEAPADKVEIVGERTNQTRAMSLRAIGISVTPLTGRETRAKTFADRARRLLGRAAGLLGFG